MDIAAVVQNIALLVQDAKLAAQDAKRAAQDAKGLIVHVLTQAPQARAPFLSPTTARDLLEALKSSKKFYVVAGDRLPWAASFFSVALRASGASRAASEHRKLFATLPLEPYILKEKAHLQPWLSKQTPLIDQEPFQVTWVDGHTTPSIETRKADILHYVKGYSQSVYQLAYLGDLKSQTANASGDPTDESIACLVDFLCALAAIQVWRREFVGYLLDGKHISFFVIRFDFSPTRGDTRAIVSSVILLYPPFPSVRC